MRRGHEFLASLVLCGPALLLYAGFMILPMLMGFRYSMTDWSGWTSSFHFVGLDNFRELARDRSFLQSIRFTLYETALIVAFFTFATMFLAVLLDASRRFKDLIRGMFFYPYILSILVCASMFKILANYREGAVNVLLRKAGLEALALDWMGDPRLVGLFIFALVAWNGMGFFTTLYLANLQTIPAELYEAARIDGAGPLRIFGHVQFPMLLPTLTTNSVLALITGINLFPQIVVTTEGGPGRRTFTIGYYIYKLAITDNRQGYATAIAFVTFLALVAIAALQVALLRRRQTQL